MPDMIWAAARFTVVMPEPQKRSRVMPLARTSKPAARAAMRPRSLPCLPRWDEVPQITSSTSAVLMSLRWAMPFRTVAARCWGWKSARAPLPTLPMPRGVRAASMIQASPILRLPFVCAVPRR